MEIEMKKTRAKTPVEVAEIVKQIYEQEFGGKDRGRFQISRAGLREISGRKGRLEESIIKATIDEAYELGLVVTEMGDDFSVIEASVMHNYRKVPKQVISNLA
jgi:hypothetical protein